MSDDSPNKNDIQLVFKRLRSIQTNKVCFDCAAKNPTWSSVTYGVFICIDCSAVHRSLGVHLTFVRSTQLDTNWTWLQLRQMQLGGNANAMSFFRQHNCITTDAQQKYNSRAAQLYKEKLHNAAIQAMRLHGTKFDLEPHGVSAKAKMLVMDSMVDTSRSEADTKEVDFFEAHSNVEAEQDTTTVQNITLMSRNGSAALSGCTKMSEGSIDTGGGSARGPNVEPTLLGATQQFAADRKPTIGTRKSQPKRMGLGAKKAGGLGAQKVTTNFADLEREAELADQIRMMDAKPVAKVEISPEEEEAKISSMRLAYQDLSIKQKKEEEKMKTVDPKKAQQIERLGMGFASRSGISHSAVSDMKTIVQENPIKSPSNSKSPFKADNDAFYDDLGFNSSSSNNFSLYKGNISPKESCTLESMFLDSSQDYMSHSGWGESERGGGNKVWGDDKGWSDDKGSAEERNRGSKGWAEKGGGTSKGWGEDKVGIACKGWGEDKAVVASKAWGEENRGANRAWGEPERRQPVTAATTSSSTEAQKKFGSAKAISSDQYFGDMQDAVWERKTNLSRFEGSSSISSAEYFNRGESLPGGTGGIGSQLQVADLEDVKESVRQGVTKVAGKLSSLANGVMSSIQEKYGGY